MLLILQYWEKIWEGNKLDNATEIMSYFESRLTVPFLFTSPLPFFSVIKLTIPIPLSTTVTPHGRSSYGWDRNGSVASSLWRTYSNLRASVTHLLQSIHFNSHAQISSLTKILRSVHYVSHKMISFLKAGTIHCCNFQMTYCSLWCRVETKETSVMIEWTGNGKISIFFLNYWIRVIFPTWI